VAIIGASEKEGSIGFSLVKNVGQAGYQGKILENGDAKMSRMGTLVKSNKLYSINCRPFSPAMVSLLSTENPTLGGLTSNRLTSF